MLFLCVIFWLVLVGGRLYASAHGMRSVGLVVVRVIFMEIFVYNPRERATVHLSTRYSVADGASQHCGGPGGTSHGFVGIGMHAA